jgi:excisionase family DNA binding protein
VDIVSIKNVTESEPILTNTVKRAADRSGLSERSIWNAIAEQKLKAIRVAGRVLIPEEALRSFLGLKQA